MNRLITTVWMFLIFSSASWSVEAGEWAALEHKGPTIEAWLVMPTVMITEDVKLPEEKGAEGYIINTARAECECVQLVIKTADAIEDAEISFSELHSKAGAILPERLSYNSVGSVKNLKRKAIEEIPDILLPEKRFSLSPGRLNTIWLTLSVPPDAPAGRYDGELRLRAASRDILAVPMRVKVWDCSVPAESHLIVMGNVWTNAAWFARYTDRPMAECLKDYYDNLKAHRLNATASIYSIKGHWSPEGQPEFLAEFEQLARYVLDDLGFKRFRFPGAGGAVAGTWNGIEVFSQVPVEGAIFISGRRFDRCEPAGPKVKWMRRGGASVEGPRKAAEGSWVEYDFTSPRDLDAHLFVQIEVAQPDEAKEIFLDGKPLGKLTGADCPKDSLGFGRVAGPVRISAGQHTLRIVIGGIVGHSDPICNIILCQEAAPDFGKILYDSETLTEEFKAAFRYHVEHAGEYLKKHGWLSKAQLKPKDEPTVGEYGRVARVYEFARELLPENRRELSEGPHPILWKGVNLWMPYAVLSRFDPKACAERKQKGDEVWLYYNLLHTIGYNPIGMQLIPWMLYRYDLDGYLFWSVNYWGQDPYERHQPDGNSALRGTMIYPNRKDGTPVNSIRWELFREGLEDYACLESIAENAKGLNAGEVRQNQLKKECDLFLQDISNKLIVSTENYCKDPVVLAEFRVRMYGLMERLGQELRNVK